MRDFVEGISQLSLVVALGKSDFWYGLFTVMHYFTLFILTGSALIFDLFLLGVIAKGQKASKFADQIFPWIWTSMFFAVFSGFTLALVTAGDYYVSPVMRWKIVITLLGFLCTLYIYRNVQKWDGEPVLPGIAKLVAVISILLWVSAVMAGNDIAALCGLG